MNRISRQLLKIAREINALDEEGDGSGFQYYHDQENHEQEMLNIAQKQGKKYILHHKENGLWRIQACKNFGNVKKGDFGGLIASAKNLSHKGNCWVYDDAIVYNNASVRDNAVVYENAVVYGNAKVYGNAFVHADAKVYKNAQVYGNAQVGNAAVVGGNAQVYGNAFVYNAQVYGNAKVDYEVKNKEITV